MQYMQSSGNVLQEHLHRFWLNFVQDKNCRLQHPNQKTAFIDLHSTFRLWILIYLLKFRKTDPPSFCNPRVACCLVIQALSRQESTDSWVLSFQDTPGFIVNRLLVPYMMEAVRMLERGELNNVCIFLRTEQQLNQTEDKSSHFSSFLTI